MHSGRIPNRFQYLPDSLYFTIPAIFIKGETRCFEAVPNKKSPEKQKPQEIRPDLLRFRLLTRPAEEH